MEVYMRRALSLRTSLPKKVKKGGGEVLGEAVLRHVLVSSGPFPQPTKSTLTVGRGGAQPSHADGGPASGPLRSLFESLLLGP